MNALAKEVKSLFATTPTFAERKRVRGDVSLFISIFGRDKGSKFEDNDFSRHFDRVLSWGWDVGRNLGIAGPPGVGKSTRARLFLIHRLINDPNTKVIVASNTENIAESFVGESRKLIDSPQFRAYFPNHRLDARERDKSAVIQGSQLGKFYLRNADLSPWPAMEAVSIGTVEEARRVDIGLFDDIMGYQTANSPELRKKTMAALEDTWLNGRLRQMGGRNGIAIAIQNVYHKQDVAHRLTHREDFTSVWYGITDDFRAMFVRVWNPAPGFPEPEVSKRVSPRDKAKLEYHIPLPLGPSWTPEALAMDFRSGPPVFKRKFHLKAMDDSDRMFPHFDGCKVPMTVAQIMRLENQSTDLPTLSDRERNMFSFAWGWNISSSKRPGDVLFCMAVNGVGIVFPVEIHIGQGWTLSNVLDIIDDSWHRGIRNVRKIKVESEGVQDRILAELQIVARKRKAPYAHLIDAHQTAGHKMSEEHGLPAMASSMEQKIFLWPEDEGIRTTSFAKSATEFENCLRHLKPGESPDTVMAGWFAFRELFQSGFAVQQRKEGKLLHSSNIVGNEENPW